MTTDIKDKIWQKIGEAGLVVLLMAVVIYVLYTRASDMERRMQNQFDQNRESTQNDIKYLKQEVSRCREDNMEILIKTNENYIKVIEKNNRLIENLGR